MATPVNFRLGKEYSRPFAQDRIVDFAFIRTIGSVSPMTSVIRARVSPLIQHNGPGSKEMPRTRRIPTHHRPLAGSERPAHPKTKHLGAADAKATAQIQLIVRRRPSGPPLKDLIISR